MQQSDVVINASTAVSAWTGERARYDGLVALLQDRSGVKPPLTKSLHVKRTRRELAEEAENEMMEREQRETTERSRPGWM